MNVLPLSEHNIQLLSQFYDYWVAVEEVISHNASLYIKLRDDIVSDLPKPLRGVVHVLNGT
jgi:hypothetical protein